MIHTPVNLLIVEDDVVDRKGLRRALKKRELRQPVYEARDGLEALEALRGTGGREPLPRPNMVLLDLNMPRMGGLEFLREIRQDPALRDTIVFVLSTSCAERDKMAAYQLNVAGYIVKAAPEQSLSRAIDLLDQYCRIVEFPRQ